MSVPKNFTRRSPSIPAKLARQGAVHLLPVYFLMRLSDLGNEGIEHSGSYRFADHLYVGKASGRGLLGRRIDAWLLTLPAARAFRRRYLGAERTMRTALERGADRERVRVLAVPCGIPRDLIELVRELRHGHPELVERIEYHGLDIDPAALAEAERATAADSIRSTHFHRGDALSADDYPPGPFQCVVSTGLGEFLTDAELALFHRRVYDVLEPGGVFYTSATTREPLSARLLQMVEFDVHYRSVEDLLGSFQPINWQHLGIEKDETGCQTFLTAVK